LRGFPAGRSKGDKGLDIIGQSAFILKQRTDAMPVAEICRKAGAGRRHSSLEGEVDASAEQFENARLRKVVVDPSRDKAFLQDIVRAGR
jgi:putative transposase